MDFHSFPWLLKCHRVFWFQCKVAQLAPIMLNVKTCEDSLLNQPRDRQQNTSHVSRPSTSGPLTTVDPLLNLGKIIAEKNASNIVSKETTEHKYFRFLKLFFRYISPRLLLQSRLFWANQAEWILLLFLTVIWQNNVTTLRQMTRLPGYCFCLCVCEKSFKKAISVRIESLFVIGLPYSTVI